MDSDSGKKKVENEWKEKYVLDEKFYSHLGKALICLAALYFENLSSKVYKNIGKKG